MDVVRGTDTGAPGALTQQRVAGVLDVALHRFLGLTLVEPTDPAAGIIVPVGDAVLNNAGVLHGGVVTALLDVASYLALLPQLGEGENAVTHELTASLMRPVPAGALLRVTAEVLRRGRRLVFLRAEATVSAELVAVGLVTKSLLRAPG